METETIDRLFLELSQVTTATTAKEINLRNELAAAQAERDELMAALKWLDRWLGHKPMPECVAKIKTAIVKVRKP